jgi:pyrroloquinoline quinone biosynthesis protein B
MSFGFLLGALVLAGFTPVGSAAAGSGAPPDPPPASPYAVVLGIAQDGGVPHAGCRQELCVRARRDPAARLAVASLGLVDPAAGKRFLIDATPDLGQQIERLGGRPDGILLTHAHIGHYLGLAQLGREVMGTHRLPVYATPSMAGFLRANLPWSRLVKLENIVIQEIAPGRELELTPSLHATPIRVPHRDEDSDTVAYLVRGPVRTVLWLPDIDRWEKWDRSLPDLLGNRSIVAFVDGTFYSGDEIPGRSLEEIPHPLVPDTLRLLAGTDVRDRLFFVHLNHTNRLLWNDEAAVSTIMKQGARVASEGQIVGLDRPRE